MVLIHNEFGQTISESLTDWQPKARPTHKVLKGKYCTLQPVSVEHITSLYETHINSANQSDWTYLPYGPFNHQEEFQHYIEAMITSQDPLYFAVIDNQSEIAIGTLALMRIKPANGAMEVGHVVFSDALKNTFMATEAHYLLMKEAFDSLGYRRYEWKCDNLNTRSRKAAERLGFTFEGIFRQHIVYNNRSRDTAWLSILDSEWPKIKQALECWLDDSNCDENNQQIKQLAFYMSLYSNK